MDDKSFDEFIKGKALEENILLPSVLNQKITSTFMALPKRKKYHTGLFRLSSVAAILALCVLTSIGFASPSFASNVRNVSNTISSNISNFLGLQKNLDEYQTVINKAVTDQSITVTLNEVVLNGSELTVSYSINSSKKIEAMESWDASNKVYVNGVQASTGASGLARNIDDYTTQAVTTYALDKVDVNGDLDIKILCSQISLMGSNDAIKGSWDFEFRTNGNQLKTDTKEILLNHKFTLENGKIFTLTKYTDNRLGQVISASTSNLITQPMYAVKLNGIDNLGNKVEFYISGGDKGVVVFKIVNGTLNEKAKTLTLAPYAARIPDKSGEMNSEYYQVGDKFTIDLSLLK